MFFFRCFYLHFFCNNYRLTTYECRTNVFIHVELIDMDEHTNDGLVSKRLVQLSAQLAQKPPCQINLIQLKIKSTLKN